MLHPTCVCLFLRTKSEVWIQTPNLLALNETEIGFVSQNNPQYTTQLAGMKKY